jgi:DNA excision repair protein ERCC-6-like
MCKEFNADPSIFVGILTTGVAGYGLNLIGADRVVIFDPDWNPANDNQAIDRIYRIGQKRDVIVYRLVTIGGIEEMIYRRQIHKQGMGKATIEEKHSSKGNSQYFSNDDLFMLFKFEKNARKSETQKILEKTHGVEKGLNENEFIISHCKKLKEICAGVSDHSLIY